MFQLIRKRFSKPECNPSLVTLCFWSPRWEYIGKVDLLESQSVCLESDILDNDRDAIDFFYPGVGILYNSGISAVRLGKLTEWFELLDQISACKESLKQTS